MPSPSLLFELFERLRHGQLSARDAIQHLAARWRRRFGVGSLLDFHERQLTADPVQPVLDGWIADAEVLLHLLDRSVAADEGRHENLVLGWQLSQRRQRERPFDRDTALDQPNAIDLNWGLP